MMGRVRRDVRMRNQRLIVLFRHLRMKKKLRNEKKKRKHWVHPLLQKRESEHEGDYFKLIADMRALRPSHFFSTFRMTPDVFDILLDKIAHKIRKQTTHLRIPISVGERLAVTLRFLATGDSYFTIASSFRMSRSIVARIVRETCAALWEVLQPEVMPVPDVAAWKKIATEFEHFWQFPHCLGSIDGKHVVMQAPANSGSLYFNYKKTFSILLLAVVDAKYNFVAVDVGAYGRQCYANVFSHSVFGNKLRNKTLPIPDEEPLQTATAPMPYVFVGDEAFPLLENLMRPYPGENLCFERRIYNYRLSRARRIVENAFGIMASRFRVFRRPLMVQPKNGDLIIKACLVLHNFLRKHEGVQYIGPRTVDYEDASGTVQPGDWRNDSASEKLLPMRQTGRRNRNRATEVRELFKNHFCSDFGSVPWQEDMIQRTE